MATNETSDRVADGPAQRWVVGDARITSIVEDQTDGIPPALFFPAADTATIRQHDWLRPHFADGDGNVGLRVQAYVVEVAGQLIVVDPCVGNGKVREQPWWNEQSWPFMQRFRAAGFDPGTVDLVVHTHLHADHVGWDTHLVDDRWVPTFPQARHVYVGAEIEAQAADDNADAARIRHDSITPIVAAGLADLVAPDEELAAGLRFVPTPGHTPGHASLWLTSGGATALITGDAIHHPVQCAEPGLAFVADADPDRTAATRASMLREATTSEALVLGTHFPTVPGGHVAADGPVWRFTPDLGRP
jgi:glyoxylase-like metal-dependent hydrolase (beta-lactamase superfamily II)